MLQNASKTTEEVLKKNEGWKCVMCNREDEYNVCFKCGGIIDARKVFKDYFIFNNSLYKKYQYVIFSRKHLKEPEKEAELAKTMNSKYVLDKLKIKEKEFKERIVNIGIEGLSFQEQQIYYTAYAGEYNRLKENYEYGCRKIGYDPIKDVFFNKDIDFAEQLRYENRMKEQRY